MKFNTLLLLAILFTGCSKNKIEMKYDNGQLQESYEINKQGDKDGAFVSFYENGSAKESSIYMAGKLVGTRILKYENGKTEIEEAYDQTGTLNGPYKLYYPSGQLQLEKMYQNDVVLGTIKVYYQNGKLKEDVTMKNNEENGPFTEYYQNGAVHWKGTYRYGDNEFGLLEEWDSLGMPIKKMKCDTLAICRTFWKPGMPDIKLDSLK